MIIKRIYYMPDGKLEFANEAVVIAKQAAEYDKTIKCVELSDKSITFGEKSFNESDIERVWYDSTKASKKSEYMITDEILSPEQPEQPANIEIHTRAFSFCEKLHTVKLPKCDKIVIESYAFENCINLRNVMISAEDIEIREFAFDGCPNVTLISNKDEVECYARENGIRCIKISDSNGN